jgi:hypothetical protein
MGKLCKFSGVHVRQRAHMHGMSGVIYFIRVIANSRNQSSNVWISGPCDSHYVPHMKRTSYVGKTGNEQKERPTAAASNTYNLPEGS